MEWQPIETAPKDGSAVLCGWAKTGEYALCRWKLNSRLEASHSRGGMLEYATEYFGDLEELDDYDYALAKNFPTHWLPIPAMPEASPLPSPMREE